MKRQQNQHTKGHNVHQPGAQHGDEHSGGGGARGGGGIKSNALPEAHEKADSRRDEELR